MLLTADRPGTAVPSPRAVVRTHSFTRTTSIFNFLNSIHFRKANRRDRISADPISQQPTTSPAPDRRRPQCARSANSVCAHSCRHSISILVLLITHPTRVELPAHAAPRRFLPQIIPHTVRGQTPSAHRIIPLPRRRPPAPCTQAAAGTRRAPWAAAAARWRPPSSRTRRVGSHRG